MRRRAVKGGREDAAATGCPASCAVLGASAASSDLVLPEGSCTELPRGSSLCPARGSSVQDASGWESAGSEEALCPQRCTNWVVAV